MNKTPEVLIWSDSFNLGDERIDRQHRLIFDLINDFVYTINKRSILILQETLEFLMNYTVFHFRDEEELQKKWNYPEYDNHKQLHDKFKERISELVRKYNENPESEKLLDDVINTLKKWLLNHIEFEDQKLKQYNPSV